MLTRRNFTKTALLLPLSALSLDRLTYASVPKAASQPSTWKDHYDAGWIHQRLIEGLLDYWLRASVAPNGFIQENLDRNWMPYGNQREATVNGQGRQLYCFAVAYGLTGRKDYLEAVNKCAGFLQGMRDPVHGGYYNRTSPTLAVLDDRKTAYSSFAMFSLATAARVTKEQKYADAALIAWKEISTKMRDGSAFHFSMKRDFSGTAPLPVAESTSTPPSPVPQGAPLFSEKNHFVNVHLFEALLGLFEATKSQEIWTEIESQLQFMDQSFDRSLGYLPEIYDEYWKALPPKTFNVGHLFEWASLFSRAVELGADPKFVQLGNRSIDLGIRVGRDANTGGVWMNALAQGGAAKPYMIWWTQCEMLKVTARYAILHGRSDLWPFFDANLRFVRSNFLDHECGGWFESWVPDVPRAKTGSRAFIKGAVDGPEWGSYHQTSCLSDLIHLTQKA